MKVRQVASVLSLFVLAACGGIHVEDAPGAPHLAPSAHAEVVTSLPAGATRLGLVSFQGNMYLKAEECTDKLLEKTRELGGTMLVGNVQKEPNWLGTGRNCTGDAYVAPATTTAATPATPTTTAATVGGAK